MKINHSKNQIKNESKETIIDCIRCDEPVNLENMHPDSLSIPDDENWYAVHGPDDECVDDFRAWIVHTV